MLEKIGLPPKPSQRGNNWVVDASHCQGCSSQFTFINRKHHCRRCGGLFCNSCTGHRMVLRGQGDSPVRICEPCKTLEEAARFEMRYGNRSSRVGKASSKSSLKSESETLSEVLGDDKKESFASGMGSSSKTVSSVERATSLNAQDSVGLGGEDKVYRNTSLDAFDRQVSEKEPSSPEELRRQAVEEKKKYRVLKGEGKSDEALRAFKRGKELERQADALEISIRKSRRKALVSLNVEEVQIKDDAGGSRRGNKVARLEGKEKHDLSAELRELGWSDMDLHNEDKKRTNTSLEGEFSSLLGEISEKTTKGKGSNGSNPIDKSQVLAHKKKALELKREGNLAEAKEELKRAKVLEKQLEEQELLGAAEDSDDELVVLIRSMDGDNQDSSLDLHEQNFDISSLLGAADRMIDGNFDVTDEDMEDPEIAAALESLGWADYTDSHESSVPQVVSVDKEALANEILSLKREALTQKRAGNVSEAMSLLKKAKLLEKDLESFESQKGEFTEDATEKESTYQAASHSSTPITTSDENIHATKKTEPKPTPRKSKLMIQKELIGLKKKALALRREGRLDEAEEELKKGKILEQQLEEMDKAPSNVKAMPGAASTKVPNLAHDNLPAGDEEDENVTDQDMNDPAYLSLLKNLGWQEEHNDTPLPVSQSSIPQAVPVAAVMRPRKSRAELQRELLGLKRRALALRRQGESEEAEEVLRQAKDIEAQMEELDQPTTEVQLDISNEKKKKSADKDDDDADIVTEKDVPDPSMLSVLKDLGWKDEAQETLTAHGKRNEDAAKSVGSDATSVSVTVKRSKGEIQRELLNLKRKALALRRKGETEEAEEVLNMAKVLEAQLEELEAPKQVNMQEAAKDAKPNQFGSPSDHEDLANVTLELSADKRSVGSDTVNHGMINSDLLIPLNSPVVESTTVPPPGNSGNLIDLLTGDDWRVSQMPVEKHENVVPRVEKPIADESNHASVARNDDVGSVERENIAHREKPLVSEANTSEERASQKNETALKQEILARKRKAVALKREGKLAEAREELRQAKLLEKRSSGDDIEPTTGPAHEPVVTTSDPSPVGQKERGSSSTASTKPLSSRDRFKLQQESLSHKRQALKLRREGRTEEADAELELAKSLEAQLEESSLRDTGGSAADGAEADNDLGVEDFLDPQLLSALRAIGIDDARATPAPRVPDRPQTLKPTSIAKSENAHQERVQLEEQIKAEKVKALHLKRSGKHAEALDVLRNAKLLEKKLNSLS